MKIIRKCFLFLAMILISLGVSAHAEQSVQPFEATPSSIQGQGYIVIIVKDLFGAYDFFKFGENDQFILGSQMRNGTGTYVALDNVYFNAQFSGTANGEAFTYNFYGFNYWGLILLGDGEYIQGSEVKELSFSGINGFLFAPWFGEP